MKKLVVLGGGESGIGAARLGKHLGYRVFLSDKGILQDDNRRALELLQVEYEEGKHSEESILSADLIIKSPGIPDSLPLICKLRDRGKEVISEIEFAGRHTDATMYCITGSNGKTTTTLLLYHLLKVAGMDVGLAGNVGKSLASQVADSSHHIYVTELSSFQLDGMFRFRCNTAILTNITPDHLDRYDYCFENYVASKFRILNNMGKEDLFIYNHDDRVIRDWMEIHRIYPMLAGFADLNNLDQGAYIESDNIVAHLGDRRFCVPTVDITLHGKHNLRNAMAAILAAMRAGVSDECLREGLRSFPQVEHRLEHVTEVKGVTFINDSKATNVDSAWYALDSTPAPVVWIAGGVDKGNDYSVLYDLVRKKVKRLICMGRDNAKLIENFSGICEVVDTNSLADAMMAATKVATHGDTVLLSPCCASFDLFKNYEVRGEMFKEWIYNYKKKTIE